MTDPITDRAAWLEERRSGIGGSDIAAIARLSPYRTPLDVFLDKHGGTADSDNETPAMYWGTVLEDIVAQEYKSRTGRRIQRVNQILRHPRYDWAIAHIDRAIINSDIARRVFWRNGRLTTDRLLECKTANGFRAADWGELDSDQVPDHYLLQCQWYMGITGADYCDIAVLIGGQDYRMYSLVRDNDVIANLLTIGERFWRNTKQGLQPDPATSAEANRVWPQSQAGQAVIVDASIAEACAELAHIAAQRKQLEAQEDALQTQVKKAFGEAETITHMGRKLATWKTQTSERVDVARLRIEQPLIAEQFSTTTTSRVLRLVKPKSGE